MKPGLEIGNYVLAELLDQGGTSHVWLAYRQLEAGGRTTVAIKFPHAAGVDDPRVRDGLDDEARLRMQLQHSNIPRVIDMGLHEGLPYFVMDYITGRSLEELLARLREQDEPLRFEIVAHVAREIGYALRYAHGFELDGVSRPVLHRDVAPKSVLLSRQGAVYVVGFGIAEAAGTHASGSSAKGTLRYESPEHAMGFPTPKSDGWGLGAIMWEMIEGRPFRAEVDDDDLRRAAKQGTHDPLTREGIPEVLQQVTEGLLQVDDRERLTLDEALRLLEAPELPVQRMALADILKSCFGDALRSGGARPDSERSDAERPPAPAKMLDDGPFGLNAWSSVESEDDVALPPPPAWAGMDGPVDADSEPSPSAASEADEERATADDAGGTDRASSERDDEEPPPTTHDEAADPPMLAVLDLGESSSAVEPKPVVPTVVEAPSPAPAEAPRKGWSPAVVVPLLAIVVAGVAWVAWPKGEAQDTASMRAPATVTDPPVKPEPTPPVKVEPTPPVKVEPTPPEPTPPEPTPPVEPEPTPPVEPAPTPIAEPEPAQPDKPKNGGGSKPPRKKASGPPAQLAIELLLMADMELEVNGKLFSLGLRRTTAKTSVPSGTIQVRWRRPVGKWKRKTFEVDPGASYEMLLDDRGPKLRKK